MGLPARAVGAMSEALVWYKLMRNGWDVYRAISPSSPSDIIVHKNGHKLRIEVRTGYWRTGADGKRKMYWPKKKQDMLRNEHYAVVLHETEEVVFVPPLPDSP